VHLLVKKGILTVICLKWDFGWGLWMKLSSDAVLRLLSETMGNGMNIHVNSEWR